MKIAMLSSEIAPFAKTGGLADVLGTLSPALEKRGHEICVNHARLSQCAQRAFRPSTRPGCNWLFRLEHQ